jgi:hypothetical protein
MSKLTKLILASWAPILCIALVDPARSEIALGDLQAAAKGVGSIELLAGKGKSAASVLVIPEFHGKVLVQLNEALLLHRLKSSLTSIVLEGLLPEPASRLSPPNTSSPSVGVALLNDGTISAAEFMYLYEGVRLVPGESHETYDPTASGTAVCALIGDYSGSVLSSRQNSSSKRAVAEYSQAAERLETLFKQIQNSKGDPCVADDLAEKAMNTMREAGLTISQKVSELADYGRNFCKTDLTKYLQIEDELRALSAVRAIIAPNVGPADLAPIDKYAEFLKARDNASLLTSKAIEAEVKRQGSGIVATIIGAAHLSRVTEKLREAGLSVAVARLDSVDQVSSSMRRIPGARWELLPTDAGPVGDFLVQNFVPAQAKKWSEAKAAATCNASNQRKEQAVITEPWFKPYLEFHTALDAVAEAAFGGSGGPPLPPGTHALNGMSSDDKRWNLPHVRVVVSEGTLVVPAPSATQNKPVAIVPVEFLDDAGKKVGTKWFVLSRVSRTPAASDKKEAETLDIEKMLMELIANEKTRPNKPREAASEAQSAPPAPKIRLSMSNQAALYDDKKAAMRAGNAL